MVHRREVDGQALVFGNQGDLWKRAMTWFDHETGSVWSQPTGEAILGPLSGSELELLPSSLSTWGAWSEQFPETVALDVRTVGTDIELADLVLAAVVGEDAAAVSLSGLRSTGVVEAVVGGESVAFVSGPDFGAAAVYSLELDGQSLSLSLVDGDLVDAQSGQRWDLGTGAPLGGGQVLDRVSSLSSFESDYFAHFPDGVLLELE